VSTQPGGPTARRSRRDRPGRRRTRPDDRRLRGRRGARHRGPRVPRGAGEHPRARGHHGVHGHGCDGTSIGTVDMRGKDGDTDAARGEVGEEPPRLSAYSGRPTAIPAALVSSLPHVPNGVALRRRDQASARAGVRALGRLHVRERLHWPVHNRCRSSKQIRAQRDNVFGRAPADATSTVRMIRGSRRPSSDT
jgi:hypothetical protein